MDLINDNRPEISIIIPVFNVETYLRCCLESVLAQTMNEIEIIVVDDGSTDGSGRICDEYAEKDNRIKVIHKANGGLSSARNAGISIASAPYFMFVDSDDWVESDFCETPYKVANRNNIDLVLFSYNKIETSGKTTRRKAIIHEGFLTEEEAIINNLYFANAAWIGLYRRALFDYIKYPDGKYYEDVGTSHKIIHSASKIYLINRCLYNYRIGRPESIMSARATKEHPDKREMLLERINDLHEWGFQDCLYGEVVRLLIKYGWKNKDTEKLVEIVAGKNVFTLPYLHLHQRIMLKIFYISPELFDRICRIMGKRTSL